MSWAERLATLAIWIAPPARREWAQAAHAELGDMPATRTLDFAVGGLFAAIGWRLGDPRTIALSARGLVVVGAGVWAVLLGRLALSLNADAPSFAIALTLLALGAASFSFLALRRGLGFIVICASLLTAPAAGYWLFAEQVWPSYRLLDFSRALSLEIAGLLLFAVLTAGVGLRVSRPKASPPS
ncbi:transporter [Caulobacter vibrioides]|uniref:transporter n=1 Tax=Caulobacter vibrioides TaxID=155892 RepID=UPI000BB486B3|nr:transporter [Caulobacter vibrioides]ATC26068.1 transporter [Caulobacter vibrioides]AZH14206.1 transporter [Caulobacter vibrioides]PLR16809.1 transporter [Caulobacter vibrioides]